MRIIILGAGLTGLSAGFELSKEHDVILIEKEDEPGGLAGTYRINGYRIERYYHHMFRWDNELLSILQELGLAGKIEWRVAKTGYLIDDRLYPLNTPLEILKFPYLSFTDKIKLAKFVLRSRKMDYRKFDDVSCTDAIKRELGNKIYHNFFEPLLNSKFGDVADAISYAWLLARVGIRSNRGLRGEKLGYLRGSFHILIEKLTQEIMKNGGKIITSSPVKEIKKEKGFRVKCKDRELSGDVLISTIPLQELEKMIPVEIPDIKYQTSICALFSFNEPVLEDIYWANIKGDYPFGAIIEHTNFIPHDRYGEHLVYTATYTSPESSMASMRKDEIARIHIKALKKIGADEPNWYKIARAKYSGVIYERGYLKKIPDYRTNIPGLYVAGIFSYPNYPERSMNGSIIAGKVCAQSLISDFKDGGTSV